MARKTDKKPRTNPDDMFKEFDAAKAAAAGVSSEQNAGETSQEGAEGANSKETKKIAKKARVRGKKYQSWLLLRVDEGRL